MALDGYSGGGMSRQAMRAELLDAETELALARAWRDHGDQRALHRLVMAYMRLAISVASRFRRYGAPMGDLIQEASLGLMKAAEKFDPDRGVRFSTYAVWWIKASVQDHVMRNWSMVRTGSTSSQKSLFFNLRRVEAKLLREAAARGETVNSSELRRMVAEDLGVPLADVEMMAGRLSGGMPRSTCRNRRAKTAATGSTRSRMPVPMPPPRSRWRMTATACAAGWPRRWPVCRRANAISWWSAG